jgi:hypothetical protein
LEVFFNLSGARPPERLLGAAKPFRLNARMGVEKSCGYKVIKQGNL